MSVVIPSLRAAIAVPPWFKSELWRRARAVPSLDLRFADNKSLVDAVTGASLVTFTRASSGTFVDSAGVIQTAATDVPRFDNNPTTGESLGLLAEEQRANLLLRSEEFDNASWTKTRSSISADSTIAPNGSLTADKLVEDTTAGATHLVSVGSGLIAGNTYTYSVYAKAAGRDWFIMSPGGTWGYGWFNINNGTLGTLVDGGSNPTAAVNAVGNGWYRCSITLTAVANAGIQFLMATSNGTVTYDGNGTSGIYLWGAQLEEGAFPTSYIPTTTAAVTRSADVASITGSAFSGLYRQDEGTFYGEATGLSGGATITVRASADAGEMIQFVNGLGQTAVISAAAIQAIFGSPGTNKQAFAFKANDFAQKRVGVALETDSSGTLPVVDMATIGKFDFGGQTSLNGRIRRLVFWLVRLPNTTLETLIQ